MDRKHNLKGLAELGRKQLKRRTNEVYKSICDLAKDENVSVARFLGFLVTRSPENYDIREIGQNIWDDKTGHFQDEKVVPIESCLVAYNDCKFGWQTYTMQKQSLKLLDLEYSRAGVILREKRKEISLVVQDLPAPITGLFFPLSKAVQMTISRLLDVMVCDNLTYELV